ncbi:hypothetical protein AGMMS50284_7080 [Clostridia bacterium]|nr:hypothetical protein AGMMS50284_7080 [Clostridia bacterium]
MEHKVEVFEYLNQRILYWVDLNYYFPIKNKSKINLGKYFFKEESLKTLIKDECPVDFSTLIKTPIKERLQRKNISTQEVLALAENGQYTLCLHPSRKCNLACNYCFKDSK